MRKSRCLILIFLISSFIITSCSNPNQDKKYEYQVYGIMSSNVFDSNNLLESKALHMVPYSDVLEISDKDLDNIKENITYSDSTIHFLKAGDGNLFQKLVIYSTGKYDSLYKKENISRICQEYEMTEENTRIIEAKYNTTDVNNKTSYKLSGTISNRIFYESSNVDSFLLKSTFSINVSMEKHKESAALLIAASNQILTKFMDETDEYVKELTSR